MNVWRRIALVVAAAAASVAMGAEARSANTAEQRATVRLWQNNPGQPGTVSLASGTTVTWAGRVWILSTGHQYDGATANNRAAWDVRVGVLHGDGSVTWHRGSLAGWDHGKDLSLVAIGAEVQTYPVGFGSYDNTKPVYQWGWNGTSQQMYRNGRFVFYTRAGDGSLGFVFDRPSIPGDSGAGCFQAGLHVGVIQGTDTVDRNARSGRSFCSHSDTCKQFMMEMLGENVAPAPAPKALPPRRAELPPLRKPEPPRRPGPSAPRSSIPDWRPRTTPRTPACPPGGS